MNVIVIPSLNPDYKLTELVKNLKNQKLTKIVIVDDGSNNKDIFIQLEKDGYKVLHHEINKGKGEALKTAFTYIKKHYKSINGVITIDSDGQHRPLDAHKISQILDKKTDSIILGTRNFDLKHVPKKSKIGNKIASFMFYLTTNIKCKDTQTGLRGIPYNYLDLAINTSGSRFEYEMNFLKKVAKEKIPFIYIDIDTIYIDKNKGSNFKPIIDSISIFKVPFLVTMLLILLLIILIIII